jgi:hypothetical protein
MPFVANYTSGSSSSNVVNVPPETRPGDVMVFWQISDLLNSTTNAAVPVGFRRVFPDHAGSTADSAASSLGVRIATASEPASYTNSIAASHSIVGLLILRGVTIHGMRSNANTTNTQLANPWVLPGRRLEATGPCDLLWYGISDTTVTGVTTTTVPPGFKKVYELNTGFYHLTIALRSLRRGERAQSATGQAAQSGSLSGYVVRMASFPATRNTPRDVRMGSPLYSSAALHVTARTVVGIAPPLHPRLPTLR